MYVSDTFWFSFNLLSQQSIEYPLSSCVVLLNSRLLSLSVKQSRFIKQPKELSVPVQRLEAEARHPIVVFQITCGYCELVSIGRLYRAAVLEVVGVVL